MWITFDEQEEILEVFSEKPDGEMEKCLQLQFILMEKLTCIFSRDKTGKIHLFPQKLEEGDENEIIKLARDIGLALERIHKEKILHRDIKLENIFYSSEKKQYKLGDFGDCSGHIGWNGQHDRIHERIWGAGSTWRTERPL